VLIRASAVGVVALTCKQRSARLVSSCDLLNHDRKKHQTIENDTQATTDYGFDVLTESEARYLAKRDDTQYVKTPIIAAGNAESLRRNEGNTRFSEDASVSRTDQTKAQVTSVMVEVPVKMLVVHLVQRPAQLNPCP
jgi:hypothetical protein